MPSRWFIVACFSIACGAPPPAEDASSAELEDSVDSDASDAAEPAAAASPEDLRDVLQEVMNDAELQPYLHLELPGRYPLKISAADLPSGAEILKGPEPVEIVAAPEGDAPVLVFTEISIQGDQARVTYRYDVEGVRGSATVKKLDGRWQLTSSRVVER
jgi:hypothetical protein